MRGRAAGRRRHRGHRRLDRAASHAVGRPLQVRAQGSVCWESLCASQASLDSILCRKADGATGKGPRVSNQTLLNIRCQARAKFVE